MTAPTESWTETFNDGREVQYLLAPSCNQDVWREDLARLAANDLEALAPGEQAVLYRGRNELRRCTIAGSAVVIKSYRLPGWRALLYRWRAGKAERAFRNQLLMTELAVPTPLPFAAVIHRRGGCIAASYFLSEYIDAIGTVRHLIKSLFSQEECWSHARAIGTAVAQMHAQRLHHRDLTPGNVIIAENSADDYRYAFVDCNRMDRVALSPQQRAYNLAMLYCEGALLEALLDGYCQASGDDPSQMRRWCEKGLSADRRRRRRKKLLRPWR